MSRAAKKKCCCAGCNKCGVLQDEFVSPPAFVNTSYKFKDGVLASTTWTNVQEPHPIFGSLVWRYSAKRATCHRLFIGPMTDVVNGVFDATGPVDWQYVLETTSRGLPVYNKTSFDPALRPPCTGTSANRFPFTTDYADFNSGWLDFLPYWFAQSTGPSGCGQSSGQDCCSWEGCLIGGYVALDPASITWGPTWDDINAMHALADVMTGTLTTKTYTGRLRPVAHVEYRKWVRHDNFITSPPRWVASQNPEDAEGWIRGMYYTCQPFDDPA